MNDAPRQLPLDLPHRVALDADDFLVSQSNAAAVALIETWPNWSAQAVVVHGPAGSGKTHIVSVWRARSQARVIHASELSESTAAGFEENSALAVEDIDRELASERILFHLLNRAREGRSNVLLTSRTPPARLDVALPDLRSRLLALPEAAITAPDDTLLQALLIKHFADRQLNIEPHVVSHLIRHMERSADAARKVVEAIDARSLATRRRVTRALAAEVLVELGYR